MIPEGNKDPEDLSLGKALAILTVHPDCDALPPDCEPWRDLLHTLRDRREQLQADAEIFSKTFTAIPERGCEEERPLLAENSDFFLVHVLIAHHAEENPNACLRLFQHLNGCYLCFEEYGPVFRDYYHMLQNLGGSANALTPN